jgi:hypothetical protein
MGGAAVATEGHQRGHDDDAQVEPQRGVAAASARPSCQRRRASIRVSIFDPVIQVLDHFVLKADDAGLVLPPIVDVVVERGQGLDLDAYANGAELLVEDPATSPIWGSTKSSYQLDRVSTYHSCAAIPSEFAPR